MRSMTLLGFSADGVFDGAAAGGALGAAEGWSAGRQRLP